ncbi:aspartate-semialdehyde dehydrogenase, partial [Candidatus Aerophobetes bacterium]
SNVLPYIEGEEEKIESEPRKILAQFNGSGLTFSDEIKLSAQCNRVPVSVGHQVCVFASFNTPVSIEYVHKAWEDFNPFENIREKLSMAPKQTFLYHNDLMRPQPLLDVEYDKGMGINIGRVRKCSISDIKFVALSNNLIRGAAGTGILAAELAYHKGWTT